MKKYMNTKNYLRISLAGLIIFVWASCMPKPNLENVVVRFALPENDRAQSLSTVGPLAICQLDTSFVGAYNSTTGEASIANVGANTDPATFAGIGSGQNVLNFTTSPELTVTSGSGWNFYYFGAFGLSNCTAGNTIVSFGEKLDQNLNADTTVALNVVTAANHLQQAGATPPDAFANVTLQWRSTGATACSSDGTVHLTLPRAVGKAITTTAGIPYNVTGTVGAVDMVIGPLPKNMEYKAEVRQTNPTTATYTFEFNTKNSVGLTSINIPVPNSASGICQSGAPSTPAAPTGFNATAVSSSGINLAWTDNASNETGFKIERSLNNSTWAAVSTTTANVQAYSDTGLTASTLYYYRLSSTNGSGDSATVSASATTQAITPPSAPTGLSATPQSSSSINLLWTDTSNNETHFDLERSLDNVTFAAVSSTTTNVATYTDTGLTASTIYYYKVKARNVAGSSAFSGVVSATTNAAGVPSDPDTLVVTPGGASADLMWNDNSSNETGFEIERLDGTCPGNGVGFTQIDTTTAGTAVYQDFTVASTNSYCYRVRAVNGGTPSGYTNEFNYTH